MRVSRLHAVEVNLRAGECNLLVQGYAPDFFRVDFFVLNIKCAPVCLNHVDIIRIARDQKCYVVYFVASVFFILEA